MTPPARVIDISAPTKREASKLEEELRVEKWRQRREGLPLPELRDVTIAEYGERWLRESASRLKALRSGATPDSFVRMVAPAFCADESGAAASLAREAIVGR